MNYLFYTLAMALLTQIDSGREQIKRSIITLLITLIALFPGPLFAQVKIIGIEIPGLHQMDGQGAYDKIVTEILIKPNLATLHVYPPGRAKNSFIDCKNCCFSPANKDPDFYEFGEDIRQTDPMNLAKIYIFVNTGQPAISDLKELTDKTVGIRFGMPYGKSFAQAELTTHVVHNLGSHINLLQHGRIDAFIAYVPDAYKMFSKLNLKPFPHDIARPIAVHTDRLVCRDVPAQFISRFNQQMNKLRDSGQLKIMLGDHYIAP